MILYAMRTQFEKSPREEKLQRAIAIAREHCAEDKRIK